MNDSPQNENAPVLIEFEQKVGAVQASLSPSEMIERSAASIDQAMKAMTYMVNRVSAVAEQLPKKLKQVELEFGIKLEAEGGVPFISKVAGEGHLLFKILIELSSDKV